MCRSDHSLEKHTSEVFVKSRGPHHRASRSEFVMAENTSPGLAASCLVVLKVVAITSSQTGLHRTCFWCLPRVGSAVV